MTGELDDLHTFMIVIAENSRSNKLDVAKGMRIHKVFELRVRC